MIELLEQQTKLTANQWKLIATANLADLYRRKGGAARQTFWAHCEETNGLLAGKEWMMGAQYTVSDPYAFFFYDLGLRIKPPMRELGDYTAFSERMLQRSAVRRVRELEESSLSGSNAWDGPYYPHLRRG